ncbi:sugar phosphate isomerase/epimerase family protein [Streptomyces sp. NPDC005925]|uniref:sugar phosphate isomerase/epimerase family protein n=1 Tax=Streptomyces sp. NPDC005925 TaxID=3157172 RepID=UPI0033F7C9AF
MSARGWRERLAVIGDECGFTWQDQVATVQALEMRSIELRHVGGRSLGETGQDEVDALGRALVDAGVGVVALDSPVGAGRITDTTLAEDLATAERWLELAGRLGAPSVRVMSYGQGDLEPEAWHAETVRRLLALRELAARHGRRFLHENCVGWGGRDAESARRLMAEVGDEHLAFLMDTGNGVWYGYDSVAMTEAVLPYVRHVHIKDAHPRPDGAEPCLPGLGSGRVADSLALVLDAHPDMTLSLEPHLLVQPHLGITCRDAGALRHSVAACVRSLADLLDRAEGAEEAAR